MVKEIGSHFEFDTKLLTNRKNINWLPSGEDSSFTFSGRAAIELAIRDIKKSRIIESVYMPSYCCSSMVDPFIKAGIKVDYYGVHYNYDKGLYYKIDKEKECDIFFTMSYFGIEEFKLDKFIQHFSNKGAVIIEDVTHRLLSMENYSPLADYHIASLRKWFAIPSGGYISKMHGLLTEKPKLDSNHLVTKKTEAMKEKQKYLLGNQSDKERLLKKFKKSEEILCEINADYMIDDTSLNILETLDINKIRKTRKKNAELLYKGIKQFEHIKPLIINPDLNNGCPLFVPVMIKENRDSLHKYLIKDKIYCPIHWPDKTNRSNITKSVMSLICDQRYEESDMKYIIDSIERQLNENSKD